MGIVLAEITVPPTVGGVSAGVDASTLAGTARTINFAGLETGDTISLEGANENTAAKFAEVKRVSFSGSAAVELTLPAENSQWYRVKRIAKTTSSGTGRTVTISGSVSAVGADASEIAYVPTTPGDWVLPLPTTVAEAVDRLAAAGGVTPVP